MDSKKILDNQWLKEQIDSMGFPCIVTIFAEKNKECLLVSLAEGLDGEMQSMQIWLEPQIDDPDSEEPPSDEPLSLLHLFMPVCACEEAFMGACASVLFVANAGMDVPGFGISPVDKYVYYHSTTFLSLGRNSDILKSVMGLSMLYVDGFTDIIKNVASGKKTVEEALKELLESAKESRNG
jgi:hypothetical protein